MGASTKSTSTTPATTEKLRGGIIDYLTNPALGGFSRIASDPSGIARARNVTSRDTQSVDQLGGANSAFFNNMVAQLSPAFDMQRKLAAAQGSESAGNLTGSGFANRLGSSLNRTLGEQQAKLADYAAQGIQTEVNRQGADANRDLTGQVANQNTDTSFINNLFNTNDRNAGLFASLLGGQGTAGVGPNEITTSGGAGALLGPLAQGLGGYLGGGGSVGKIAGGVGDIFSKIFGGGGGSDPTGGIAAGNKTASGVDFGSLGIPGMNAQVGGGTAGNTTSANSGGNILQQILSGSGGQTSGGGGQNFLQQLLHMGANGGAAGAFKTPGGQAALAGNLLQMISGGGVNASNIGSMLGGIAGNAIPIPILGPLIGSILGKGVGSVAGKIGGGIKRTIGGLFN